MMNTVNESEFEYVGFWARLGASIIDTVLVVVICFPLLTLIYGKAYWSSTQIVQGPADFLLNWVLPAVARAPDSSSAVTSHTTSQCCP